MKKVKHTEQGFTLIELIVVTVLIGIMATVLSPVMVASLRAYDSTLGDVIVLDKLRYATERLGREIRGIEYASSHTNPATDCGDSPATTDHYCISAMSSTGLTFRRSYVDTSGNVTWRNVTIGSANSTVTIAYSDMSGVGAQVLTDELGSLTFNYFQKDGTTPATLLGNVNCVEATTPICISYVQINLTLNHNGNNYTHSTLIGLRTPPL